MMSDRWDFYFTEIDESNVSVFVDLGIRPAVPDGRRPYLVRVVVPFVTTLDNGFYAKDEYDSLEKLESQ